MLRSIIICPDTDLNERLEKLLGEIGSCMLAARWTAIRVRWSCCAWFERTLRKWSS